MQIPVPFQVFMVLFGCNSAPEIDVHNLDPEQSRKVFILPGNGHKINRRAEENIDSGSYIIDLYSNYSIRYK
jgi:hypothetical protein